MKKIIIGILILAFCILSFGCSSEKKLSDSDPQMQTNEENIKNNDKQKNNQQEIQNNKQENKQEQAKEVTEPTDEATLYVNMMWGSETAVYEQYPLGYSGELTPEMLADGLSNLTGLDFSITARSNSDGLTIDWSDNSTLIAGLGEREQEDEFLVYDNDSLTWLMLDSLWITLRENLGIENIYYSMFGGSDLWFEELYPVDYFPVNVPYMGSAFYYAHSDGNETIIPLSIAGNVMLSDPPEDELSYEEAYEVLAEKVLEYEELEIPDEMNLTFVYQGIMEYQGIEYYDFVLCENYYGDFDANGVEILYEYLVDGYGGILKAIEYGNGYVWDEM